MQPPDKGNECVNKSKPTILQIIPRLDTGGAERTTIEITAAIAEAGGRALVATEGGRLANQIISAGGEILHLPVATKNPIQIYWNAASLTKIIHAEGIDLVHARSRAPAWSALFATRRTGIPFVTTYHGAYRERDPLKKLYNGVMARADRVIANSQYTAELIRSRYAVSPERIVTIYRGTDFTIFSPNNINPDQVVRLRKDWGVGTSEKIVLQAARLTRWKGQSILIDAAAILNQRRELENTVVVLAGDPQGRKDYVAGLQERISALGLKDKIRIVGHVDDIAAAYLTSEVTVIASIEPEAFGRTGAEAQAMECPVVATSIGAPMETICALPLHSADKITGWLVPASDPAALADALSAAISLTPSDRKAIGARARNHVRDCFSLDQMKSKTLEVYNKLLDKKL